MVYLEGWYKYVVTTDNCVRVNGGGDDGQLQPSHLFSRADNVLRLRGEQSGTSKQLFEHLRLDGDGLVVGNKYPCS